MYRAHFLDKRHHVFYNIPMYHEEIIYIHPCLTGTPCPSSLEEQLDICLRTLEISLAARDLEPRDILEQTVFLEAEDNTQFYRHKDHCSRKIKDFFKSSASYAPPTGFVGQPPAGKMSIAFELVVTAKRDPLVTMTPKELEGIRYLTVDYPGRKVIYAAGITAGDKLEGALLQSREAFKLMNAILEKEDMDFSNVVRQWNYIEHITGDFVSGGERRQNYQVFNDVRSMHYDRSEFKWGYPAATGIGMDCGGVTLAFIADDVSDDTRVIPIQNPGQVDAHRYSQEVLEGKALQGLTSKTTPKFERAKALAKENAYYVYISGTAAIQGQLTVSPTDAAEQTRVTIENIERLVSRENLAAHGLPLDAAEFSYSHIRVYIKYEKDIPIVKEVCDKHFHDTPALYLISDVCRANLLVEIEGAVYVKL